MMYPLGHQEMILEWMHLSSEHPHAPMCSPSVGTLATLPSPPGGALLPRARGYA